MNDIEKAVKILNQGGIIIFPTDTAFGIGCRVDREDAIKKLFAIRKRPRDQAVPVLFDNKETIKKFVTEIPSDVEEKLMDRYWPGALTIVMSCLTDRVPVLVRGGGKNIGVRIPDNETILSIIKKTGTGILGPSANFHGEATPYAFEDLNPELVGLVDYVVPGECKLKNASTVIDCSGNEWQIIREGAIKLNL